MSWEIKINWDECPYLNMTHIKKRTHQEECGRMGKDCKCSFKNCPIKV